MKTVFTVLCFLYGIDFVVCSIVILVLTVLEMFGYNHFDENIFFFGGINMIISYICVRLINKALE